MRRLLPEFETWIGVQWACFCNWLLSVQNRTDTALCQLCCLAQCALVIVRERRKIAKVAHDVSAGHKVSVQLSGVWPHLISWHFQRSTAIVLTEKCWGLWCSHLRIRVAHQTCDFYFEGWTALQNRVLQIVWIYKCSFGLHIDPIPLPKSKMTKCDQLMWTVLHWDTIVFVAHPKGGRTWRGLRGSIQMSLETCWSVCDGDCGLPLWDRCQVGQIIVQTVPHRPTWFQGHLDRSSYVYTNPVGLWEGHQGTFVTNSKVSRFFLVSIQCVKCKCTKR